LILLTVGLSWGWYRGARVISILDIDRKTWAMLVAACIVVALCWQVGRLAIPQYGETAGLILTFLFGNLFVGSGMAVVQMLQRRRERAEKIKRETYQKKLREAREYLKSQY